MVETYPVREDLKKALPGPYYQVLVALTNIFDALKKKRLFDIMLELMGVGALDDIVIDYYDAKRETVLERRLLQLKHASNGKEILTESDLIYKSGKLEIFKYFDDWYLFIREKKTANAHCIYYTNRDLSESLKSDPGIDYDCNTYHFNKSFFSSDKNSLYQKMLNMILQNSVMCNHDLVVRANAQLLSKNPTYRRAKGYYENGGQQLTPEEAEKCIQEFLLSHYRMQVGQLHVEALEKRVCKQVHNYFFQDADVKAIFNALIIETWQWFRELGRAKVWKEESIKEKLKEFYIRYQAFPQEIGKTLFQLGYHLEIAEPKIQRTQQLDALTNTLESCDNLVIGRGIGVGKSTLLAEYFIVLSHYKIGEYLYFPCFESFQQEYKDLLKVKSIKIMIIDNAELQYLEHLRIAIAELNRFQKKVILLAQEVFPDFTLFDIEPLSPEEIERYLINRNQLDDGLELGGKIIKLKDMIQLRSGGLYNCMQYPAFLKALCDMAKPLKKLTSSLLSPCASPYLPNSSIHLNPIALEAKQIVPLYSLVELTKTNQFKGSKYVQVSVNLKTMIKIMSHHSDHKEFYGLDLNDVILPADINMSINIKVLLTNAILDPTAKDNFENGRLTLLLFDRVKRLSQWPELWKQALLELPIIVFTATDLEKIAQYKFSLSLYKKRYYFKCHTVHAQLPKSEITVQSPIRGSLLEFLAKQEAQNRISVITAEAGAGKSTTLKMLYNSHDYLKSLTWGRYHHLIWVPLNRLAGLNLDSILAVSKHFLQASQEVVEHALRYDLQQGQILFLLDGWDELTSEERHRLEPLLLQFYEYNHIILTHRLNESINLPDEPVTTYVLQRFSLNQIREFIQGYFQNSEKPEEAECFIENAIAFLDKPEIQTSLEIIGLPMQCYLLCESWYSIFEAVCQGKAVARPWESSSVLTRVELYQLFVTSRLRKALIDRYHIGERNKKLISAEEICFLGTSYLETLQLAAYQQLFLGKTLKFDSTWLAKNLRRIGLIEQDEFIHKTYAEYFAALYLVNLLRINSAQAERILLKYRYQAYYRLVFEFIAGIVSYGDPIIPAAKSYMEKFWQILLAEPRDWVGIVDRDLLCRCYAQSDKASLKTLFTDEELTRLEDAIVLATKPDKKNKPLPEPKSRFNPSSSDRSRQEFEEPAYSGAYTEVANKIDLLPVENYDLDSKQAALEWLLEKMNMTDSFRIKEACVRKLRRLGIATDPVISTLLSFILVPSLDPRSNVRMEVLYSLISLGTTISKTERGFLNELLYKYEMYEVIDSYKCCVAYLLLHAEKLSIDEYFEVILSIPNKEEENSDLLIAMVPSMNLIIQNNIDALSRDYILRWSRIIYSFALKSIKEYIDTNDSRYKHQIPMLIISLIQLNFEPKCIEEILKFLLSPRADHGFWDVDVVQPCMPYFLPYFSRTIADYIVYKTTRAPFKFKLYQFFESGVEVNLLHPDMQKILVATFLEIHRLNYEETRVMSPEDFSFSYIEKLPLEIIFSVILRRLDSLYAVSFLWKYMTSQSFALVVYDQNIQVYTPSNVRTFPITSFSRNIMFAMSMMDHLFPNGVTRPVLTQNATTTQFLLGYPDPLFLEQMKRKRKKAESSQFFSKLSKKKKEIAPTSSRKQEEETISSNREERGEEDRIQLLTNTFSSEPLHAEKNRSPSVSAPLSPFWCAPHQYGQASKQQSLIEAEGELANILSMYQTDFSVQRSPYMSILTLPQPDDSRYDMPLFATMELLVSTLKDLGESLQLTGHIACYAIKGYSLYLVPTKGSTTESLQILFKQHDLPDPIDMTYPPANFQEAIAMIVRYQGQFALSCNRS